MLALLLAAAAATAPAAVRLPKGATPPMLTNMQDVFTSDVYPADALRDGIEGVTRILVKVNSSGRPVACSIRTSSGSASLDSASCRRIMESGKFTPARDRRKRAIAGELTKAIAWRIANVERPVPLHDVNVKLTYQLSDGMPVGLCRGEASPSDGSDKICEQMRPQAAEFAADIPIALRGGVSQLVITFKSSKDSGVVPARPMGIPGQIVLDDRYFRLTVDGSGKVIRCSGGGETLAKAGGEEPFCDFYKKRIYVSDPKGANREMLFQAHADARK